jgi:hypothetical protein
VFHRPKEVAVHTPADHPSGATGARRLALVLSGGYLAVAGAIGAVLLATSGSPQDAPGEALPVAATTTTRVPTFPTSLHTTTTTTTTTPQPAGFDRTAGPGGLSTVIPAGWPVVPCASSSGCSQSDDPADPGRFLRFGGTQSPAATLHAVQSHQERQFAKRPGYQRVRFESGTYHGYPSVEWEFEWNSNGTRRHVRVTYWRAGGYDYLVYASSTLDKWPETISIYQAMIDNSLP